MLLLGMGNFSTIQVFVYSCVTGQGLSYGSNVLALIGRYTQLLIQRAFNPKTFGPLEVSAFILFVVSILGASFSIWSDLRGKTKEE